MVKKFAVVGGGISGLTAAYRLQQMGCSVTLFEGSERFGGALQTLSCGGCLMEAGPDSFIVSKPSAMKLAGELGLEVIPSSAVGPPGVVHGGQIQPLPEGFRLLAPTKLLPFVRTPLLSPLGKLRAGMEWLIPASDQTEDESVGDFVTRRFGREVLESLAQPLVGGIYAADPATLSLLATLPMFRQLEQSAGSVTAGMLAQLKRAKARKRSGSMFFTPRAGMTSLVNALVAQLQDARLTSSVSSVSPQGRGWRLDVNGAEHHFDALILACPAAHLSRLTVFDPQLSESLTKIPSTTTVTIQFVFDQDQIQQSLRGSGFVVPQVEGLNLTACTYSHLKYAGRAPEGKALLRCHVGNAMNQETVQCPDSQIEEMILAELRPLIDLKGEPEHSVLIRHRQVMPQYQVGHKDLVQEIDSRLAGHPTLALAGNGLAGVGVSDCISRAAEVVERLVS